MGDASSCKQEHEKDKEVKAEEDKKPVKLTCIPHFDALWFCYSPFYQMKEYYREGSFNDCRSKWSDLFDCFHLKTKSNAEVQAILEERNQQKPPHIWTFRTTEEASKAWNEQYGHLKD